MKLERSLRQARRWLADGPPHAAGAISSLLTAHEQAFLRTELLVRVFYILSFVLGIELVTSLEPLVEGVHAVWLWPVAWFSWIGPSIGLPVIFTLFMTACLIAAFDLRSRAARSVVAVGLLLLLAARFSSGKIDHGYHFWLWTAGVLCLLPGRESGGFGSRMATRQYALLVFFAAQVCVALFFSISGAWKLAGAGYQTILGEPSAFSPDAMARQVAEQFVTTHQITPVGRFLVENPGWGHGPYLVAILLELLSVALVFRLSLHRALGCALMLFQLGTRLVLDVWSPWGVALVGLLFVASPFAMVRADTRPRDASGTKRAAQAVGPAQR